MGEERNFYKLTVLFSTDGQRIVFPHEAPKDPKDMTTLLLDRINDGSYSIDAAEFRKISQSTLDEFKERKE